MEHIIIDNDVLNRMHKALGTGWTNKMTAEFGIEAVNFSKERFVRKTWQNRVHEPWKPRKRPDRGSLMVRTGRLKRSIRKISSGTGYVIIGTNVPYARVHNEGGKSSKTVYVRSHTRKKTTQAISEKTGKKLKKRVDSGTLIKVKSHTRRMNLNLPQRKFMGNSRALELRLQLRLKKSLKTQLNNI